jgi:hypothetical protein
MTVLILHVILSIDKQRCFILVAHEDVGMNLAAGFLAGVTQGFHKAMAILVIAKKGLALMRHKSSSYAGGLKKFDSSWNGGGGAVFHGSRSAIRPGAWIVQGVGGGGKRTPRLAGRGRSAARQGRAALSRSTSFKPPALPEVTDLPQAMTW